MLHLPANFTSTDLLKDGTLAGVGFILPVSLSTGEAALIVGLVNAGIVCLFRCLELRRRNRRDEEIERLRARIDELVERTADGEVR